MKEKEKHRVCKHFQCSVPFITLFYLKVFLFSLHHLLCQVLPHRAAARPGSPLPPGGLSVVLRERVTCGTTSDVRPAHSKPQACACVCGHAGQNALAAGSHPLKLSDHRTLTESESRGPQRPPAPATMRVPAQVSRPAAAPPTQSQRSRSLYSSSRYSKVPPDPDLSACHALSFTLVPAHTHSHTPTKAHTPLWPRLVQLVAQSLCSV